MKLWFISILFGFLAFVASYCFGIINEQNHLIARSVLWAIFAFLFTHAFKLDDSQPDEDEDSEEEEDKDD